MTVTGTVNFEPGVSWHSGFRHLLATKSPWKMKKNAFYFTLKAPPVLEIFKFLPWLFGNVLIKKIRLMTSQPGKQTIPIHILRNISRSNENQTMKFGQLTEYSTRNIFLEKSWPKCAGKTIPRPNSKSSKLSISLD